jgi:hypothetical protein
MSAVNACIEERCIRTYGRRRAATFVARDAWTWQLFAANRGGRYLFSDGTLCGWDQFHDVGCPSGIEDDRDGICAALVEPCAD